MNNNEPQAGGDTPAPRKDRRGPAGETNVPPVEGLHNKRPASGNPFDLIANISHGDQLISEMDLEIASLDHRVLAAVGKFFVNHDINCLAKTLANNPFIELRSGPTEIQTEVEGRFNLLSLIRLLACRSVTGELLRRSEIMANASEVDQ